MCVFTLKNPKSLIHHFLEKAYWMVEECFKKIHDKQMEQLELGTYAPLNQEREIDGKMDKKRFLQYVKK